MELQRTGASQALDALSRGSDMANNLRGQEFQEQSAKLSAQDVINQFNAGLMNQQNQRNVSSQNQAQAANLGEKQRINEGNTGIRNQQQQYNTGLRQQNFNNQMSMAQSRGNVLTGQANQAGQFGANQAAQTGNIVQGGTTLLAGLLGNSSNSAANKQNIMNGISGPIPSANDFTLDEFGKRRG